MRPTVLLGRALVAATAPAGCKLVKNPDPAERREQAAASQGGGADVADDVDGAGPAALERGGDRPRDAATGDRRRARRGRRRRTATGRRARARRGTSR